MPQNSTSNSVFIDSFSMPAAVLERRWDSAVRGLKEICVWEVSQLDWMNYTGRNSYLHTSGCQVSPTVSLAL